MDPQGFWRTVFRDLPQDADGHALLGELSDAALAKLRAQVKAGTLTPPAGEFTINPTAALNKVNRGEVQGAFIRYRRMLDGLTVRAYVPVYADGEAGPATWGPRPAHPWADTRVDPQAAALHAQYQLAAGVSTSVRLHGAALMRYSGLTAAQVGGLAYAAVDRAVARLAEADAQPGQAAA